MARPIKPKAIRRNSDGATPEVLTSTGHWLPITNLSDASKDALRTAIRQNGYGMPLPLDEFHWLFDITNPEQWKNVPVQQALQPVQQEQQDNGDPKVNEQPNNDQQQRQEPQPQPNETMEDIVKRIAGHLDAVQQDGIDSRMDEMLAELATKVETLLPVTPKNEAPLRDVVRIIEMRREDREPIKLEGMFHKDFHTLCRLIAAGKHIYIPGVPGGGKSHHALLAIQILNAHIDGLDIADVFWALSLGPTTPESRLWGGKDANGNFNETGLLRVARHAMANPDVKHVIVLDEMDNGHAGILATTNSAKANGWFFAPNGDLITLGDNIVFIGCANTYGTGPTAEFAGRNKLDAATLDRYTFLPWETDEGLEIALTHKRVSDVDVASAWLDVWHTARRNVKDHGLKQFVTMRGCLNGADLLEAGFAIEEALMFVLGNKVPADQWAKINPL